ncbi:leucine-rich repeat domain-containing protein [Mycoplasma sp. ES3157-GEN-MYC]|uniref:leucine-rich repeat domain-containing protein n=1 Tax=Mycoplasma miroungigenitalium TaxID=754515 RepID=UPI001C1233C8|nr:leucine-rich repeat domain-containing protein [Mycoplasma miroungigenitalium]MBU4690553.1 leucine-rich repeat domain-containing protein [Mycoplasma miroungigenitalium]MBU4691820.1 leucine-rich repeat domain-containing protein [Mycoplasma miroungigenitalium]
MKTKNKILLSLGISSMALLPVATISCQNTKQNIDKDNIDKYFDYEHKDGIYYIKNIKNGVKLKKLIWNSPEQISFKKFENIEKLNTITEIELLKSNIIPEFAFKNFNSLKTVVANKVGLIGKNAFENTGQLVSLNVPNLKAIMEYAFKNSAIRKIDSPNLLEIKDGAFINSKISEINTNKLQKVGIQSFSGAKELKEINAPELKEMGASAFENATSMVKISMPQINSIGFYAFKNTKISEINTGLIQVVNSEMFSGTTLSKIVMPNVTEIRDGAFKENVSLKDVEMPKVKWIGIDSFAKTKFLNSIRNNDGISIYNNIVLDGKQAVGEITLPNVLTIAPEAFKNADKITKISLPNVINIGDHSFQNANHLTAILMPKITELGKSVFENTSITDLNTGLVESISTDSFNGMDKLLNLVVPNAVKVENSAFEKILNLETIELDNVLIVEDHAFNRVKKLKRVKLPKVKTIGKFAFAEAINLEIIEMPNVEEIGEKAFYKTNKLTEAKSNKLINLGSSAFEFNTNLKVVDFPNLITINSSTFKDCSSLTEANIQAVVTVKNQGFKNCSALTKLILPNLVTVGESAFENTEKLNTFEAPKLNSVGNNAFKNSGFIQSLIDKSSNKIAVVNGIILDISQATGEITLSSLTTVPDNLFKDNTKITSIKLPNVTEIGNSAFNGCTALAKISAPKLIKVGDFSFGKTKSLNTFEAPKLNEIGKNSFAGSLLQDNDENYAETGIFLINGILISYDAYGEINKVNEARVIADSLFEDDKDISEFVFSNVEIIGKNAFANSTLTKIEIPNVKHIKANAFKKTNIQFKTSVFPEGFTETDFNNVKKGIEWNKS